MHSAFRVNIDLRAAMPGNIRTFGYMRPVKIQIRLRECIRAVWSESSLGAFWFIRMPRLSIRTTKTLIRLRGNADRRHVLWHCGYYYCHVWLIVLQSLSEGAPRGIIEDTSVNVVLCRIVPVNYVVIWGICCFLLHPSCSLSYNP